MSPKSLKLKQLSTSITEGKPLSIEGIGPRIHDVRTAMGMTQAQLAKKLKMSQPIISRIEKNAEACSLKTLSKVAQALGCNFLGVLSSEISLEEKIIAQAEKKARDILKRTFSNMALEKQTPNQEAYDFQLKNLVESLAKNPGPELWEEA